MKLLREICRATIAVTFETFDQNDEETWPDQKYLPTYIPTYLPTYIPN